MIRSCTSDSRYDSRASSQGYVEKNPLDSYTVNSITGKKGAGGAVVVQFGGCDGKIPNCIPITWKFPQAIPVS